jgi:hypothetical protein
MINPPNINKIRTIYPSESISDTVSVVNTNYSTLFVWTSAIQQQYDKIWQPVVDYYNQYEAQLKNSLTLVQSYSAKWDDFQTIVESNSSKWIQPFTIFYPTLIQNNITTSDVDTITTWLKEYFPIRNSDNSLNYVEDQKFIVSCYIYSYDTANKINISDDAFSYAICNTSSGTIYAHCETKIAAGDVYCYSQKYSCAHTAVYNPSMHVDCWYSTPYLYDIPRFGSPITDNTFSASKQRVRGQIRANIGMYFTDRREDNIKQLLFTVGNCEWIYGGLL